LLVMDPASGAVLLFQYEDDGRRWWATPGGALDGDETFEDAAIREAAEELDISSRHFLRLWHRTVEFHSAAPVSARKSIISCFEPHGTSWLSDRKREPLTVERASSRRGGGHPTKSRPRPSKCFPKTFRSACATFVDRSL
jgi:8-oxo-dGTP pyrophosphatase MutT (NUDIX family)